MEIDTYENLRNQAPPSLTLRQLHYFVAVAETGSISSAAVRLHVSESAVNLALTALERVLKVQLCIRRRARGIELTASGRDFAVRAAALLADSADLLSMGGEPVTGSVVLGCTRGLAPQLLPPIAAACASALPGVSIEFELLDAPALLERLDAGAVDLAVVSNLSPSSRVGARVLCESPVHVLLPADHRFAHHEQIDLRDLAAEPYILLDSSPSAEHAFTLFARAGVSPMIRFRTSSFELVRSLVARGLGFSLQIVRPAGDLSYEGLPLAARRISIRPQGEAVLIAWSDKRRQSRIAQRVIAIALSVWADAPRSRRLDDL